MEKSVWCALIHRVLDVVKKNLYLNVYIKINWMVVDTCCRWIMDPDSDD